MRALLHALAEELRRLTGHVEELHFLDLAGRLSMRLVRLARDRDVAGHRPRRARLALYTVGPGCDDRRHRQSVNRLLSGLVDDGLISIDRDTLIINDLAALERHGSR